MPAGRDLWEPVAEDEWAMRFRRTPLARRAISNCNEMLRIGHLVMARRQSSADIGPEERRRAADIEDWCAGADEFGSLLWLASSLDDL